MKFLLDGKEIRAGEGATILDAALEAGVFIPHLCNHPDLKPVGGCKLCSVEVEGMEEIVSSCKTTVQEGMVVHVNSPKADKVRKMAMEIILASHPADCTGCPKYGKCELQSMYQYMGVGPERWKKKSRVVPNDDSNPLIQHLFTRCVRCGRCIRACRELRGCKVLDFQRNNDGIRPGTDGNVSLKDAGCKFCGACIEVCPTGSIMDTVGMIKEGVPYSDSVVPCRSSCPGSIDIPSYIRYIKEGDFAKATAVVRERVPFPEILGCICTHACEEACKRNELGDSISICKLKRSAAYNDDGEWKKNVRKFEPTGKKVAVIGGGPAGLTAAYYLVKKGHEVTVFEENEKAGGQCRYGIPAYRLPDHVIDKEIAVLEEEGVKIITGVSVRSPKELLEQGYDAALISVGTHQGTVLNLEGNNLDGVYVNTEYLKNARLGTPMPLGDNVMVLGGGNVAFDCARTAIKSGAKNVHIACLENREQMTATNEEIIEGLEEGVILHSAHSFSRITGNEKVEGVELQKVDQFYFDENRKAVVECVEGSRNIISVDNVIFAVGQRPKGTDQMGIELINNAYAKTNEDLETSMKGVYAAGDVVTGTKSVIEAIASGRKSAEEIDKYLGGDGDITEVLLDKEMPNPFIGRQEGFADLERLHPEFIELEVRRSSHEVIEKPFDIDAAKAEASRCLQCDLRLNISKIKLWNEY